MNISSDIHEAIKNDKLVFFVGSGFSKILNFPNWRGMVIKVLEKLEKEDPKYTKLMNALEFFPEIEVLEQIKNSDLKNKKIVYDVLKDTFLLTNDHKNLLDNHKKIGQITSKIITTNYDKAIEEANPEIRSFDQTNEYFLAEMGQLDGYIFKLHGSIDNPTNCIVFKNDYEELYDGSSPSIERLKNIISDHTIIFLGFSMTDPFVQMQFEYINSLYKGLGKIHYILTTSDEKGLEKYGVSQIKLEGWEELPGFLDALCEKKKLLMK
ncbi:MULTISPECIES: SIR2 family protein [Bacillus cereus group]|uniref:SIR2 family protein n=1 Tax=Bacillus cereus group TaxID=86661 RepID=UPI003392CE12